MNLQLVFSRQSFQLAYQEKQTDGGYLGLGRERQTTIRARQSRGYLPTLTYHSQNMMSMLGLVCDLAEGCLTVQPEDPIHQTDHC